MIEGLILKLLKDIESRWDCISFAYQDEAIQNCWLVAVDDYELYKTKEYKELIDRYRKRAVKVYDVKLVFCYQYPSEQLLESLIKQSLLLC